MNRWDEHREKIRQFENDVFYEAWRSGMNPDRAIECAEDCYWNAKTPIECVSEHRANIWRRKDPEDAWFDPDAI